MFGGIILGFIYGWLYAIVIVALSPLLVIGMSIFILFEQKSIESKNKHYSKAGGITDSAFNFIKNIKSLNGEDHECKKYEGACRSAMQGGIKFGFKSAFYFGLMFFSIFGIYTIAFFVGSRFISN